MFLLFVWFSSLTVHSEKPSCLLKLFFLYQGLQFLSSMHSILIPILKGHHYSDRLYFVVCGVALSTLESRLWCCRFHAQETGYVTQWSGCHAISLSVPFLFQQFQFWQQLFALKPQLLPFTYLRFRSSSFRVHFSSLQSHSLGLTIRPQSHLEEQRHLNP